MFLKINHSPMRYTLFAVLACGLALAQAEEAMPFRPVDNSDNNQSQTPQPPMMPGSDVQTPPVLAQTQIQGQGQAQPQAMAPEPKNKPGNGPGYLNADVRRNEFGQPITRAAPPSKTYAVPDKDADKKKGCGKWSTGHKASNPVKPSSRRSPESLIP
ncbi:MAG: hypothetical protein WCI11_19865 [Candidatus Methylumidiphilus sp.]